MNGPRREGCGSAYARAALAGNPSDGYGGAVLAVTLSGWQAQVQAIGSSEPREHPRNALVAATERRFAGTLGTGRASVRWRTSIPQHVGLGSSSALAIAVIRALGALHGVTLSPAEIAELALAVETEDLAIVAGPQDRVVQSYGGLVFMDFAAGAGRHRCELLDESLLPPLVIAWRRDAAASSGHVHERLRDRHRQGDPPVRESMAGLARAARQARDALLARDAGRFAGCVDRTFDLRAQMLELDTRCVEMIEVARAAGAAANYTGSGGAIVAVCRDDRGAVEVVDALDAAGCEVARP